MTPSVRQFALLALVGLSIWLGYLLGKDNPAQTLTTSNPSTTTGSIAATAASESSEPAQTQDETADYQRAPDNVYSRVAGINARIEYLGAQSDDRVINRERIRLLNDLAVELNGANGALFADSIRYYNRLLPRDGAGLLLESHHHRRNKRWQAAMESLLTAAEFPESNEQLEQIHAEQAQVAEQIYSEFADRDDWLGLADYYLELLLRDPNNDRIRLRLASVQAQAGDLETAIETLDGTGTQGVSRQEIDELQSR